MLWFLKSRVLKIAGYREFDVSASAQMVRRAYYGSRIRKRDTDSADAPTRSQLFNSWWYYSIELLPGLITKGIYPADFPLLPRILLRNCDLSGSRCLDLGSMEGLIPVLMARQGARSVLATDASFHCYEKMAAVKRCYGVNP